MQCPFDTTHDELEEIAFFLKLSLKTFGILGSSGAVNEIYIVVISFIVKA